MRTHKINKISNKKEWLDKIKNADQNQYDWININILPWGGDYKPKTLGAVSYDDYGLNVYMRCYEGNLRFEGSERNAPVHLDSCMEFFFSPVFGNLSYLNFEINPIGSLYTGHSSTGLRADSGPVLKQLDKEYFNIISMSKTEAEEYNKKYTEGMFWDISYTVPFEYIKKFYPDFDINKTEEIKANLYKCGDMTLHEHYIVWNNIETETPNYHVPEFFGVLEL